MFICAYKINKQPPLSVVWCGLRFGSPGRAWHNHHHGHHQSSASVVQGLGLLGLPPLPPWCGAVRVCLLGRRWCGVVRHMRLLGGGGLVSSSSSSTTSSSASSSRSLLGQVSQAPGPVRNAILVTVACLIASCRSRGWKVSTVTRIGCVWEELMVLEPPRGRSAHTHKDSAGLDVGEGWRYQRGGLTAESQNHICTSALCHTF